MDDVFIAVKNSIISQLNRDFSETDIFCENIPQTKDRQGDYFFISLMPISAETVSSHLTKISILVDIIGYLSTEKNAYYLRLSMQLDDIFCPVFTFEDRAITVYSANTTIVDHVLHYTFTLRFMVSKDIIEENDLMQELDSNYNL